MEKSEAVRRFNEGKHFVETCLEQIASLEQSNDKELRKALRGTVMVEVSYKAAENFGKVGSYVIDGKDGAQQLKDKLFGLKEKLVQLYNGADRQNLVTIKTISEAIISEIKEVEEWAGDEHFIHNPIPETGDNGCFITGDNTKGEDSGDGDSDDGDSGDEVPDVEGDEIILPIALKTEKAKILFTAAYNEGWMIGNNTGGFTWIGFGNISKATDRVVSCTNQLAYLCYQIYKPYTPAWDEIERFFGEERLDRDWSNTKDKISDNCRPSWMNTIDYLIRNNGY